MSLKGIDMTLLPKVFPLSLDPVCQKWFYSLPDKETATWEDVTHAFMTRYKSNTQNSTSHRELEILKQGEKEGFTAFLTKWRQTAAKMVNPPAEESMVNTFIDNLQPVYKNRLRYLGLETFEKVYKIGIQIENDVLKQSPGQKGNSNQKGPSNSSENITAIHQVDGEQNNVQAIAPRPQREFTPLGMTYTRALDRLVAKGILSPIGPTNDPPPERRRPDWNPDEYCKYHRGRGHSTEKCWPLRHRLQDMIEDGRLPFPPAGKKLNI